MPGCHACSTSPLHRLGPDDLDVPWVEREDLEPARHSATLPLLDTDALHGLSATGAVVSRGGGLEYDYLPARCPEVAAASPLSGKSSGALEHCVQRLGIHTSMVYQPSRFWAFQWIELSIFLVLALALVGFVIWWIRLVS